MRFPSRFASSAPRRLGQALIPSFARSVNLTVRCIIFLSSGGRPRTRTLKRLLAYRVSNPAPRPAGHLPILAVAEGLEPPSLSGDSFQDCRRCLSVQATLKISSFRLVVARGFEPPIHRLSGGFLSIGRRYGKHQHVNLSALRNIEGLTFYCIVVVIWAPTLLLHK